LSLPFGAVTIANSVFWRPVGDFIADQQGVYFFVVEEGKAAENVVIEDGLSGGEQMGA
jgi:hypothetical protein